MLENREENRGKSVQKWIHEDRELAANVIKDVLPPRFARFIGALDLEGASIEETARRFNVKPNTVRDEGLRGRIMLAEAIGLVIPETTRRLRTSEAKLIIKQIKQGEPTAAIRLVALWPGMVSGFTRQYESEEQKVEFVSRVIDDVTISAADLRWDTLPKLNRWLNNKMASLSKEPRGTYPGKLLSWMENHPVEADQYIGKLSPFQQEIVNYVREGQSYEEIHELHPERSMRSLINAFYKARRTLEERIGLVSNVESEEVIVKDLLTRRLSEARKRAKMARASQVPENDLMPAPEVSETNLEEDVLSQIVPEDSSTIRRTFRLPDVGTNLVRSAANGNIQALEQVFSRDLIEGIYRYFYFELYSREPLNEKGNASSDTPINPQDLAEAFSLRVQSDIVQALRGGEYRYDVSFNAWVFRKCREIAKQNKGAYKKRQVADPLPYLKGDDRTILVLKDAVGLDLSQIAEAIRKPRPWVYRHWLAAEETYSKSQEKTA